MSIDKNISKALDIEPIDVTEIEVIPPVVPQGSQNTVVATSRSQVATRFEDQEDFDLGRDTMRDLIEKGVQKLDEFGALASDLETARAYEVYAGMLEKIAGLTEKLYDMHHSKKSLRDEGSPSTVNIEKGVVFTGNQTEVLQELKKQNGNG